ncbi:uncharacterized protein LOC143368705 [Andrena cerasifolii]|uniref:uncharacterized protein LOC143368705 n=1 Tax=Andrena cerasifolii TaxID=2819439 RepID=UPI004037769F
MQMGSAKKLRAKNNQRKAKKIKHRNKSNGNDEEVADEAPKVVPKQPKEISKNVRKMFFSTIDPYDRPLKWWESEHVRYAINYPPVKRQLEKVMGSHVVRFTDRIYMMQLAGNIARLHMEEQELRIEGRKLTPPSIISRLMEISYRALFEKIQLQQHSKIKLPL